MIKQQMYRVVLEFDYGITRSVFVKAKSRKTAEERALRRNPSAKRISRERFPLN